MFFVTELAPAIDFYVNALGFTKVWHSDDGAGTVCQVTRSECEIVLAEEPGRTDRGRIFVELTPDGLAALLAELSARYVHSTEVRWGYDTIRVADPYGNELFFPRE